MPVSERAQLLLRFRRYRRRRETKPAWATTTAGAMAPASLSHTVELAVAENEKGFTMEFWAQEIELYTIGFISPTGEAVSPLPASTTDENAVTFLLERDKNPAFTISWRIFPPEAS